MNSFWIIPSFLLTHRKGNVVCTALTPPGLNLSTNNTSLLPAPNSWSFSSAVEHWDDKFHQFCNSKTSLKCWIMQTGSSSLCPALATPSPWFPLSLCHCVILCFDVHSHQEGGIFPFLTYFGCTDFCACSPLNFPHLFPQISLTFLLSSS